MPLHTDTVTVRLHTDTVTVRLQSVACKKYKIGVFDGQYFLCILSKIKYNQIKYLEYLERLFYAHVSWQCSLKTY